MSRISTFKLAYSLILTRNQNFMLILMHLSYQQGQYWPKTQHVKQINMLCIHQNYLILLIKIILLHTQRLQLWLMPYTNLGITCYATCSHFMSTIWFQCIHLTNYRFLAGQLNGSYYFQNMILRLYKNLVGPI